MSIAEKFKTIAENVQKVFNAGKKAEYDAFWDEFQQNGNRTDYDTCFRGERWNVTTFKPKYDLKPVIARNMFQGFGNNFGQITLTDCLERAGVVLDCSNVTIGRGMFRSFHGSGLPPLVFNKATDLSTLFYDCLWVDNIDITLNIDKSANIANMFNTCRELKNLIVRGVIAGSGVSLQWSTGLTKASFVSVINALSNETSGITITFSQAAKEAAFTAEEWSTLIATKPNWTISLV